MTTEHRHASAMTESGQGLALAVCASLAVLLGRGLAPALPGTRSGIEVWITRIETGSATVPSLAAFLAQLTLLWGGWLCMHLLLNALADRGISAVVRALMTLSGSLMFAIVALANVALAPLTETWLVGIAACAGTLGLLASILAFNRPSLRAAGIVLMIVSVSGLLHVVAGLLALRASSLAHASEFMTARILATLAFGVGALGLVFALYWVIHSGKRLALALFALMPPALLIYLSLLGTKDGANFFSLLAARTLNQLRTHPDPLVLPAVRDMVELSAFAVGLLVLSRPVTQAPVRVAVALALISQANIDVPLCALLFSCAALVLISHSTEISKISSLR